MIGRRCSALPARVAPGIVHRSPITAESHAKTH